MLFSNGDGHVVQVAESSLVKTAYSSLSWQMRVEIRSEPYNLLIQEIRRGSHNVSFLEVRVSNSFLIYFLSR